MKVVKLTVFKIAIAEWRRLDEEQGDEAEVEYREARSACNTASSLHGGVRVHRDRARRVINGPHEFFRYEFADVRAVRLDIPILRRELAHAHDSVLRIF